MQSTLLDNNWIYPIEPVRKFTRARFVTPRVILVTRMNDAMRFLCFCAIIVHESLVCPAHCFFRKIPQVFTFPASSPYSISALSNRGTEGLVHGCYKRCKRSPVLEKARRGEPNGWTGASLERGREFRKGARETTRRLRERAKNK